MNLESVDDISKFLSIASNMAKVKFEELSKTKLTNTDTILLFDISSILRYYFSFLVKSQYFYDNTNIVFSPEYRRNLILEIVNIIAHYKRFINSRLGSNVSIYVFMSREDVHRTDEALSFYNDLSNFTSFFKDIHVYNIELNTYRMTKYILTLEENSEKNVISFSNNDIMNALIFNYSNSIAINIKFARYMMYPCDLGESIRPYIMVKSLLDNVHNRTERFLFQFRKQILYITILSKVDKKFGRMGQRNLLALVNETVNNRVPVTRLVKDKDKKEFMKLLIHVDEITNEGESLYSLEYESFNSKLFDSKLHTLEEYDFKISWLN